MRIVITRPAGDAERTAVLVRQRGLEPIIMPVSVVEAQAAACPAGVFHAILITSRNAVRHGHALLPAAMRQLPVFAVGARTGQTAEAAGWTTVHVSARGDAQDLAALVASAVPPGARLLYLTGEPRKAHLEQDLATRGFVVTCMAVYRAVAAQGLDEAGQSALRCGDVDGVLHYSRAAATRFLALCAAADLSDAARRLRHFCLSRDAAAPLTNLGADHIFCAEAPTEHHLLRLLDHCRGEI